MNWQNSLDPINDAIYLRQQLVSIVHPRYLKRVKEKQEPQNFIGVHVRRGDFLNSVHHFKDGGGRHVNTPIDLNWYVEAIFKARELLGDLPVICISDGTESELKDIFKLENIRIQTEHPIVDLLTVSNAAGFIASGSTFSQWISYLGQMDTWINSSHTWYGPEFLANKLHTL